MNRSVLRGLLAVAALLGISSPVPARADANSKPATLPEIRDAVDWAKIPRPNGWLPGRDGLSLCTFDAPGTFQEAATFFRKSLSDAGWREDALPAGVDQKQYLYLTFQKGNTYLVINGYRPSPEAFMTIALTNAGNVDLREYPKPGDAKFLSNGRLAAIYTTGATPQDATEFHRKALTERGWKEVPAESAKFFAKEGRIVLRFLQNAMEIGVVSAKNMTGETEVTLTSQVRHEFDPGDVREYLTPKAIPAPPTIDDYLAVIDLRKFPLMKDASKRERQSEPMARSAAIGCQAPGTLIDVVAHHRKHLLDQGWKETRSDSSIDRRAALYYEKKGYLLTVDAGQEKKEPVQIAVVNHGNVDLRQLPYPPGTEIYPERDAFLNCTTTLSQAEATEFYRKELTKLGWHEVKELGRGNYSFLQKATYLRIEIGKDTNDRTAIQLRTGLISAE
jgi:hypothetical protein